MQLDMSFIPDATQGNWKIDTMEIKSNDLFQAISFIKSGRHIPEGVYKRLMYGGTVVMTNTPDEIRDFLHFTHRAKGTILINGLGLGCVLKVLLEKQNVTKITVIEKNEEVINLVSPYFKDERLTIIHADAFEYKPPNGEMYDYVWHDIWNYICEDNLPEMTKLHRKYSKRTSWQDSWAKKLCKKLR